MCFSSDGTATSNKNVHSEEAVRTSHSQCLDMLRPKEGNRQED